MDMVREENKLLRQYIDVLEKMNDDLVEQIMLFTAERKTYEKT